MKKLAVMVLAMAMLMMVSVSPVSATDNTDNNTYVNVQVITDKDVEVIMDIDSGGSVSICVDGVPLQETFSDIWSAIDSVASWANSGISNNSYRISLLSSRVSAHDEDLELLENMVSVIMNNTIYNKLRHDELRENYDVLEDMVDVVMNNTIYNKLRHDNLKENYDAVFQMHENEIRLLVENLARLMVQNEGEHDEFVRTLQLLRDELDDFKNDCEIKDEYYENRLDDYENRLDCLESENSDLRTNLNVVICAVIVFAEAMVGAFVVYGLWMRRIAKKLRNR